MVLDLIRRVSLPGLLGAAGVGGMIIGISGLLVKRTYEDKLNSSQFLRNAVDEMAKHEEIIKLLGEYKVGQVNHRDQWSKIDDTSLRIRLPIEGTERNANLLIYAHRSNTKSNFVTHRIEMIFDRIDSRRLLVLDNPIQSVVESPSPELLFVKKK